MRWRSEVRGGSQCALDGRPAPVARAQSCHPTDAASTPSSTQATKASFRQVSALTGGVAPQNTPPSRAPQHVMDSVRPSQAGTGGTVRMRGSGALGVLALVVCSWGLVAGGVGVRGDEDFRAIDIDDSGRPMPPFIYLREAQTFSAKLHVSAHVDADNSTNKKNRSTLLHFTLFSVVPDRVEGVVYTMFTYNYDQFRPLVKKFPDYGPMCRGTGCSDLQPHLWDPRMGNLRCEFVGPDGQVYRDDDGNVSAPVPITLHSAKVATSAVFVGECRMPPTFRADLALDNLTTPLGVRVLREGDAGTPRGVLASGPEGEFEADDGRQCMALEQDHKSRSRAACAQACLVSHKCQMWQWSDAPGVERGRGGGCWRSSHTASSARCSAAANWVGGRRRHEVWDAVDTARHRRRLISFGCSMPVFGDGAYSLRIPQWLEFQLLNFPDAHFFVYLRGGDGRGNYTPVPDGMPGLAGGVAVLWPYIAAGVVTVVWLPADPLNTENDSKNPFQKRDENDYLYRARHLSEWASASVDYDEYFAPTRTLTAKDVLKAKGSHFPSKEATHVDFAGAHGDVFFPVGAVLERVTEEVEELTFVKWPAKIPETQNDVYIGTSTISKERTAGKLGKYIVRPRHTKLLFTHMPLTMEPRHALNRSSSSTLVLGDTQYNLLHFRDRDWETIANVTDMHRPYNLTQGVARALEEALWKRYNSVPLRMLPQVAPATRLAATGSAPPDSNTTPLGGV